MNAAPRLTAGPHGTSFDLRVQPNAPRCALRVEADGSLHLRIDAPPVDGAANEQLIRYFADLFDVARGDVRVLRGERGRRKTIAVDAPIERVAAAVQRALR